MSERVPSAEERLLEKRLRCEATASRPAFSEALYQRIVGAIHQRRTTEISVASRAAVAVRRGRGLAAVLAAACLLGAAAIVWQSHEIAGPPGPVASTLPVATASLADLPSIGDLTDEVAVGLDGWSSSVELTPQAAHLEHDACLAADSLLERLPIDVELAGDP